uniref:Uncharacterized protein n=1 Tax=Mycena chlorophos TaxID=658473 RepID=A0ABQ0LZU3_MYCCL|nr:predicted protein [Mycena chlorophos]
MRFGNTTLLSRLRFPQRFLRESDRRRTIFLETCPAFAFWLVVAALNGQHRLVNLNVVPVTFDSCRCNADLASDNNDDVWGRHDMDAPIANLERVHTRKQNAIWTFSLASEEARTSSESTTADEQPPRSPYRSRSFFPVVVGLRWPL